MTPKRQCWWLYLPPWEKHVRLAIKYTKTRLSIMKTEYTILKAQNYPPISYISVSNEIKQYKAIIKALRKTLPVKPYWNKNKSVRRLFALCPNCQESLWKELRYCPYCGKKLDWSDRRC